MAQATLPRMWRDAQRTVERSTVRLGPRPVAQAKRHREANWKVMYVGLALCTIVAVGYVALCGYVSELDAVRYRLAQEIALEQSHQAQMVREINARASYGHLQSVIAARKLTTTPADVLQVPAPHPLPAEMPTVLLTPQPYRGYASRPPGTTPREPASASLTNLP